jgi:hypothetical protein
MFAVGIEGFWTIGTIVQAGFAFGLLNKYGWRLLVVVSTIPYGAYTKHVQCLAEVNPIAVPITTMLH